MRQAVIYLRVSTIEQTTANQERELREIASRMGPNRGSTPRRLPARRCFR